MMVLICVLMVLSSASPRRSIEASSGGWSGSSRWQGQPQTAEATSEAEAAPSSWQEPQEWIAEGGETAWPDSWQSADTLPLDQDSPEWVDEGGEAATSSWQSATYEHPATPPWASCPGYFVKAKRFIDVQN